ncbi:hypothetical protein LIER_36897 [Lithospermum erythrorhizon]|uniref:GCK domain-containing protein n=1 Tax=Lithospermum erythrorhizon TaxID=34254 RepID=A0AAV3PDT3_LITER
MPSSDPSPTHQTDPTHQRKTQQDPPDPPLNPAPQTLQNDPKFLKNQESNEFVEEEEEGECGFCLFMKAGGCRETFIDWEKCVDEGEKNKEDIVEKCHNVTKALKQCMEANPQHYGPILEAEKAAEMEVIKELEKEKEGVVESIEVEKVAI